MHGTRRTATVTCHTDVQLLIIAREDYVNMSTSVDQHVTCQPDFIAFLRSVEMLDGWPVDVLPYNKPHICTSVYFRSPLSPIGSFNTVTLS